MPEAQTEAAAAKPDAPQERTLYAASGGRKTAFSFVFLVLLPFFVSLPAMIYMRMRDGLTFDALGLGILALAFAALMFLIVVELMYSLRARVEIGDTSARLTLPAGRGPTPMLRYRTSEIPYDQVQSVETRREIYGSFVPVLLKGARVNMKDGSSVPIGYVSEANVDPAFPYPVIARQIADRARLPLIDRGNVRRSVRRKMMGIASSAETERLVDEKDIAKLNQTHSSFMLALVGGLLLLIAVGIVDDIQSGGLQGDWGHSVSAEPQAPVTPVKPPKK